MKATIKGFLTIESANWRSGDFKYTVNWWRKESEDHMAFKDYIKLCDYDIEIEAPDNLEDLIRANALKSLQEKRKLILAENQQRVNDIDRQIGELLAIENKDDAA